MKMRDGRRQRERTQAGEELVHVITPLVCTELNRFEFADVYRIRLIDISYIHTCLRDIFQQRSQDSKDRSIDRWK